MRQNYFNFNNQMLHFILTLNGINTLLGVVGLLGEVFNMSNICLKFQTLKKI